jgi:DNA-binding transcriptional regulator YiaG
VRASLHVVSPKDETCRRSALRIRAIRAALGMRQLEFAFYLKVAQNTVSNWETGRTLPSGLAQQAIRNLCAEHGVDLNTLRRFA